MIIFIAGENLFFSVLIQPSKRLQSAAAGHLPSGQTRPSHVLSGQVDPSMDPLQPRSEVSS